MVKTNNGWVRVGVKVPTVNKAWYHKGNRRYLTKAHTQFKADVAVWLTLTEGPILPEYNGSLEIHYRFSVSNANTDIDNLIKPAQDAICDFVEINDNRFKGLTAYKK